MNKMKKSLLAASILVGTCVAPMAAYQSLGQELTNEAGEKVDANATAPQQKSGGGFTAVSLRQRDVWKGCFKHYSHDCQSSYDWQA